MNVAAAVAERPAAQAGANSPLVTVRGLEVAFVSRDATVQAVNGVDFDLRKGETLAIVGESGCGKSVTSSAIMQLLPKPAAFIPQGEILFNGSNILDMSPTKLRSIRGDRIAMIFQEPQSSLNPVFTIKNQMAEMLKVHKKVAANQIQAKCVELLQMVGIPAPEERRKHYPHELCKHQ